MASIKDFKSAGNIISLVELADSSINSCKNTLVSIITNVDGITQAHLEKLGFTSAQIQDLTSKKAKYKAIKDKIIAEGY